MQVPKIDMLHKILFILFIIFIIFLIISIVFKKNLVPKEEQFQNQNENRIVLCHATWCPHCTNFKPAWDSFKQNNESKFPVKIMDLDSDRDSEEIKQYEVQGFPTVILVKNGEHISYEGPRTEEGLVGFLKENFN